MLTGVKVSIVKVYRVLRNLESSVRINVLGQKSCFLPLTFPPLAA
jgi:hypothetical protein